MLTAQCGAGTAQHLGNRCSVRRIKVPPYISLGKGGKGAKGGSVTLIRKLLYTIGDR